MVTHLTLEDLGPGLHVMREVDPLKQAGPMATSLGADLCATLPQAEAALEERSTLPTVDPATLSALEVLARRIARAQRIAIRTRDRAVVEAEQRLAGVGSGVAVHPSTIRERASTSRTASAMLSTVARTSALSALSPRSPRRTRKNRRSEVATMKKVPFSVWASSWADGAGKSTRTIASENQIQAIPTAA